MSFDSKIQSARQVIDEHNSTVDAPDKIDFDNFLQSLRKLGGTSEQTLKAVSWEDLQSCGIPKIMARSLAHMFRQADNGSTKKSGYVSERKANGMDARGLLERYNPKDVKNAVGKRLKERSEGKCFIIFDNDGKVVVEESAKLLEDLENNLPEVDRAFVGGRPTATYRVGDRPDSYANENPIYPGRSLRSGETCDQTGRSWDGVSMDIRQLLWIAVERTEEICVEAAADANDILDRVMTKSCTLDTLRSRYPQASLEFDELSKTGSLPLLKMKLGGSGKSDRGNQPFGDNIEC